MRALEDDGHHEHVDRHRDERVQQPPDVAQDGVRALLLDVRRRPGSGSGGGATWSRATRSSPGPRHRVAASCSGRRRAPRSRSAWAPETVPRHAVDPSPGSREPRRRHMPIAGRRYDAAAMDRPARRASGTPRSSSWARRAPARRCWPRCSAPIRSSTAARRRASSRGCERADRAALLDPRALARAARPTSCSRWQLKETPVHEAVRRVARTQVRASLAARAPVGRGAAGVADRARAPRRTARPRWAEKTPRHLVRRCRSSAASGRTPIVIRVVRDPRDVALSLARVPVRLATRSWSTSPTWPRQERDAARVPRARPALASRCASRTSSRTRRRSLRRVCARRGRAVRPGDDRPRARARRASPRPMNGGSARPREPLDPSRAGGVADGDGPRRRSGSRRSTAATCCARTATRARATRSRSVAIVPLGDQSPIKHEALLLAPRRRGRGVAEPVPAHAGRARAPRRPGLLGQPRSARPAARGARALERTAGIARLAALLAARRARGRAGDLGPAPHELARATRATRSSAVAANLLRGLARTVKPARSPGLLGLPTGASRQPRRVTR